MTIRATAIIDGFPFDVAWRAGQWEGDALVVTLLSNAMGLSASPSDPRGATDSLARRVLADVADYCLTLVDDGAGEAGTLDPRCGEAHSVTQNATP
jgi:hypothetical protein